MRVHAFSSCPYFAHEGQQHEKETGTVDLHSGMRSSGLLCFVVPRQQGQSVR
uniref:Uncharacterized protein n=1 Tax=Anguilla anguilla TaxID=7936 RepID=A0A0E9UCJ5_ANGAN